MVVLNLLWLFFCLSFATAKQQFNCSKIDCKFQEIICNDTIECSFLCLGNYFVLCILLPSQCILCCVYTCFCCVFFVFSFLLQKCIESGVCESSKFKCNETNSICNIECANNKSCINIEIISHGNLNLMCNGNHSCINGNVQCVQPFKHTNLTKNTQLLPKFNHNYCNINCNNDHSCTNLEFQCQSFVLCFVILVIFLSRDVF